ncbi:MAG: protein jag [Oscillospiraceae bacterium]|nr:protein jag [Oscillospiraceae bacterium]
MIYDDEGKLIPMDLSGTFTGKSIDEAKQKAADEFGVRIDQITFRVLNDVKKGLFGKIKEEAKVWAGYNKPVIADVTVIDGIKAERELSDQVECCRNYLKNIMDKMGIDAEINIAPSDDAFFIDIDSKGSGAVIGRRGETLDALQYLTSLVVNKFEGDYKRVTLNSCGYREKREETLIQLANKIGNKALKTGRATTLEPMNPYERRIIHSAVAKIEGVNSKSVGEEPYRKVVISPDHPKKNSGGKNGGYRKKKSEGPRSLDLKTSFEKDYKKPKPEDNINAGLYGKIEL